MYADELLRLYELRENNFNQVTPIETKAIAVKSDGAKPNVGIIPDVAMFLIFLAFSTVGIIVFLRFSGFWKIARDRTGTIKHVERLPCRNCRYFTDSPYLKCAVHPDTALTKLALDCPDYCARMRKK